MFYGRVSGEDPGGVAAAAAAEQRGIEDGYGVLLRRLLGCCVDGLDGGSGGGGGRDVGRGRHTAEASGGRDIFVFLKAYYEVVAEVGIVKEDVEDYQRDVVVVSQTACEGQGGVVLGA